MPDSERAAHRPIISIVSKQRIVGATNGSSAYLIEIAKSLHEAGYSVELIQPSPAIAGRTPIIRMRGEMAAFAAHRVRGAWRIGRLMIFPAPAIWWHAASGFLANLGRKAGISASWTIDRPQPYAVATPWLKADHSFLRRNLDGRTSAVIADYMFCAPAFEHISADLPKAIVMHDLFHARDGQGKDSVALVDADEEIEALSTADIVLAIQQQESDIIDREVPDTEVLLVPMPAHPVERSQPGQDRTVLFIGSNTAPNSEGLRAFLEETWPLVLKVRPDCRLDVAGTVDRAFAGAHYPNVSFLGMVDDLAELYANAGVVISPLSFGSGLKIKLIEAMAKGKALVVSSVTLQGVESICTPAVRLADQPNEVASNLLSLIDDRNARQALGTKALECAENHFAAATVHASLRDWADRLR